MIKFVILHNYISRKSFLRENSRSKIYELKLKRFNVNVLAAISHVQHILASNASTVEWR